MSWLHLTAARCPPTGLIFSASQIFRNDCHRVPEQGMTRLGKGHEQTRPGRALSQPGHDRHRADRGGGCRHDL